MDVVKLINSLYGFSPSEKSDLRATYDQERSQYVSLMPIADASVSRGEVRRTGVTVSYIADRYRWGCYELYQTQGDDVRDVVAYDADVLAPWNEERSAMYAIGVADRGVAYILSHGYPYRSIYGNDAVDRYITQAAIWWYLDEIGYISHVSEKFKTTDPDQFRIRPHIVRLVKDACDARNHGEEGGGEFDPDALYPYALSKEPTLREARMKHDNTFLLTYTSLTALRRMWGERWHVSDLRDNSSQPSSLVDVPPIGDQAEREYGRKKMLHETAQGMRNLGEQISSGVGKTDALRVIANAQIAYADEVTLGQDVSVVPLRFDSPLVCEVHVRKNPMDDLPYYAHYEVGTALEDEAEEDTSAHMAYVADLNTPWPDGKQWAYVVGIADLSVRGILRHGFPTMNILGDAQADRLITQSAICRYWSGLEASQYPWCVVALDLMGAVEALEKIAEKSFDLDDVQAYVLSDSPSLADVKRGKPLLVAYARLAELGAVVDASLSRPAYSPNTRRHVVHPAAILRPSNSNREHADTSAWGDGRSWPGTPGNGLCPCGSGEKYKNCHKNNERD